MSLDYDFELFHTFLKFLFVRPRRGREGEAHCSTGFAGGYPHLTPFGVVDLLKTDG
jgi:hypothetical protein